MGQDGENAPCTAACQWPTFWEIRKKKKEYEYIYLGCSHIRGIPADLRIERSVTKATRMRKFEVNGMTRAAFPPHKTRRRCPNKRTEILYCVACTNIYISPHCLFNKANESPSLLPSSMGFFFFPSPSIVLKEGFFHPAEEPLSLLHSPLSVRGHASSSWCCVNTLFPFVWEEKCICVCQHTKPATGGSFFFSSLNKGPIKVYFSLRQL